MELVLRKREGKRGSSSAKEPQKTGGETAGTGVSSIGEGRTDVIGASEGDREGYKYTGPSTGEEIDI